MSTFIRTFSKVAGLATKQLEKDEIIKAIDLLSSKTFNSITPTEKIKYIGYFTKALNADIKPTNVSKASSDHFSQSLLGLNSILKVAPVATTQIQLDPDNIKDALSACNNEKQVLAIFDELLATESLKVNNFKHILVDPRIKDMSYIFDRLEFMKLHDLQLLLCSKCAILNNLQLANIIYERNINIWLDIRSQGKLSRLLEKTLYQLIWKMTRDLNQVISLDLSQSSYILLLEALPRQYYNLSHLSLNYTPTKNQMLFLEFLSFLVSKPVAISSNKFIQTLIRMSAKNGISFEVDDNITIYKYRYLNGLLDLCEQMQKEYGENETAHLLKQLHELDEAVQHETVLRFV